MKKVEQIALSDEQIALSLQEQQLLQKLNANHVKYMIVGQCAAVLQGARGATEDVDLWFADLNDPNIIKSVQECGGIWISGNFSMHPPQIGGEHLSDRFDVVTHMSGLASFDTEYENTLLLKLDNVEVRVLSLRRIIHSKRSAGRKKDLAMLPVLEEALIVIENETKKG